MNLPLRQQEVLQAVAEAPGQSMRTLHKKTGIPLGTVVHSLIVLEGKGLIRRVPKQNGNSRSYECYLTNNGATALFAGRCE